MNDAAREGARAPDRLSRGRRATVRVLLVPGVALAGLYLTLVLTDALGLTAAHPVPSPDDPAPSPEALAGAATPGEAVHVAGAAAMLATFAIGALIILLRPGRPGSAGHLLAAAGALIPVALIVGNPDNHGGQAGVVDPLFLALPLPAVVAALLAGRRDRRASAGRRGHVLLGFAAAAAGPAVWWSVEQALMQRNTFPPTADPHHNSHWFVMAAVGLMIVLLVVVAGSTSDGWRLPAATAAVDAVLIGTVSLLAPHSASALGRYWSAALILWGLGILAVALRAGRSRRGSGSASADQLHTPEPERCQP